MKTDDKIVSDLPFPFSDLQVDLKVYRAERCVRHDLW